MTEPRFIEIKTDAAHSYDNELERLAFSAMDTVWHILNEYAVRVTLQELREAAEESGVTDFPSDDQLFADAIASGEEDAPKSYVDLYPGNLHDRLALSGLFAGLLIAAGEAAGQAADDIEFEDIIAGYDGE
jgi:hypothetical protein